LPLDAPGYHSYDPAMNLDYQRPYLYPKQFAAIFDPHRFSLIEASSKAGKTSGCIAWIVESALSGKEGWNYWWVAPVSDQAGTAFRRTMRSLPEGTFTPSLSHPQHITLLNGTVIWFKSGDKPNCYDEQTEILTSEGWKFFRDLRGDELVMTRKAGVATAEWQRPIKIIHSHYAGEMIAIESKRIDACVTPNHRMLIERRRGATARGRWKRNGPRTGKISDPKEMIIEANDLLHHDRIPGTCKWDGIDDERIDADFCALIGFYLAEGSAIWNRSDRPHERVKRSGYRIHFAQIAGIKGGDKGDVRQHLIELLLRLGLSFKERKDGLLIWNKKLWNLLIGLGNAYTKRIPERFKNLPVDKLKILLHWMILGDGHIRRGNCSYFTVSRQLADDVQEIVIKCGWSATIRERQPTPYKRNGKIGNASIGYIVNIQKQTKSHYLNCGRKKYVRRVPYDGVVHCVTVPNGIILVRRNGKPLWSGNSLYGEDVYACVIDEASRMKEDAYIALRTTLTYTRGPIRIIGNVKGRRNWFYELARRAEKETLRQLEPRELSYHKIIAWDAVEAGVLDKKEIDDARTQMPESAWKELFLAEAADDGGNPFGESHIDACVKPISEKPPAWWGWDLAKKLNWTVGIALDIDGRCCRFERFQMPWGETMNRIKFHVGNMPALVDSTGVGDPIVEQLIRENGENFQGYQFTSASKQRLMEGLAVAIQGRTIAYPPGEIVNELKQIEYEYTRTGVRYAAPEGYDDDCVMALALANMSRSIVPPRVIVTADLLARAKGLRPINRY
jgi:hypothetical protein